MKAVVTGGAGFIGSHVAEQLLEAGHQVLVVDDLSGGFLSNIPSGAELERVSVLDPLDRLFTHFRPDAVYHLAAYAAEGLSHHIPVFTFQNNAAATANVLSAAYRSGARYFVFTSSIAAYGHPQTAGQIFDEQTPCRPCDPYGISKFACEQYIAAFHAYYGGPDFTIFRPHNVFGPRQNISDPYRNVVGIFLARTLQGEPMPIFGDGSQTRSFSYISSVACAIASSPNVPAAKNRTFNIGGDEPMSVARLAEHVAAALEAPCRVCWLEARKEVQHAHCSHDLARSVFKEAYARETGIVPGLKLMADYVRAHAIPPATECPAPIEIEDALPPSWAERLRVLCPERR